MRVFGSRLPDTGFQGNPIWQCPESTPSAGSGPPGPWTPFWLLLLPGGAMFRKSHSPEEDRHEPQWSWGHGGRPGRWEEEMREEAQVAAGHTWMATSLEASGSLRKSSAYGRTIWEGFPFRCVCLPFKFSFHK